MGKSGQDANGAAEAANTIGQKLPWAEPAWFGALESPYYNDSHRRLQAYARKYHDENVLPHALEWEAAGDCPESAKEAQLRSGLALLDVPAEYRPAELGSVAGIPVGELDAFHMLILTDEGSRYEGGVGVALSGGANVIGLPPIINHGSEAQKQRWLPGLFTGEVDFCLGITEASGGSDVGNLRTTATKTADGKHYVVNGTKKWITGAQWATHMTAAVRTGGPGVGGISLLTRRSSATAEGVTIEKIPNSGQNAGGASWVRLRDVRVPADHLLGVENAGFKYIMTNFNKERFVMAVGCNRKARTCLSAALAYAHDRETFGQPLISHQIIRHKITTLAREVEAHWAWLEQIAYHVQKNGQGWRGDSIAGPVALAKVSGGRILELAAREAQQVMGGVAYQKAGPGGGGIVEQITRDLRMMVVGGGSEEILGELAFREEMKQARKRGLKL
ncbi:acyl-CoA dehydrogenase-like protein [Xylariales sp. PMI_506]|nr:acyl-CoA dehydrogenase-like protein [Xylariales sp. PMI_506]